MYGYSIINDRIKYSSYYWDLESVSSMEILEFGNKENKNTTKYFKWKGHCENSIMNPGLMIKEMDHVLI